MCIEGYPDRNTPTILVYKDGDIVRQFVTLMALGGTSTREGDLERMLVDIGALKESDVRLKKGGDEDEDEDERRGKKSSIRRTTVEDDDDDDWD